MSDSISVQVMCGEAYSPIATWRHGGVSAPYWLADVRRDWEKYHPEDRVDVQAVLADIVRTKPCARIRNANGVMTEADSPGDAGAVVIDVSGEDMKFTVHAGYLRVTSEGLVDSREEE